MAKSKRPKPTAEQLLVTVPIRNERAEVERLDDDHVVITVPLKKKWFMGRPFTWFMPIRPQRRIELDALGAEVWDLCNNRRNMEQIIETFAQRHQLSFHEARLSVSTFMRSLVERGCIVMAIPDKAEDA